MRSERIACEVYDSRLDAVNALTIDALWQADEAPLNVPAPLVLDEDRGVTCVAYDHDAWAPHQSTVTRLLRSLVTDFARHRIVLDFSNQVRISHPTLPGIMWLWLELSEVDGRFAVCNINRGLLHFLQRRFRSKLTFPMQELERPRSLHERNRKWWQLW